MSFSWLNLLILKEDMKEVKQKCAMPLVLSSVSPLLENLDATDTLDLRRLGKVPEGSQSMSPGFFLGCQRSLHVRLEEGKLSPGWAGSR